jgi:type II secretory pathway component GspD/PulD (secretin)
VEGLLARTGFKMKAAIAGFLAVLAVSCGEELEVRTFELSRLDAAEAEALVAPYVFEGREGAPGLSSHTEGVLTVREMPENLDRIASVLERFDEAAADVRLHFQIIEADGFTQRDEAIAEVEAELRKLLRYGGYRLMGEAVMQAREGVGFSEQRVQPEVADGSARPEGGVSPLRVTAQIGRVSRAGGDASVTLSVSLSDVWNTLLSTTVTVTDGKTMVLGTTSGEPTQDGEAVALILVVTPTIQ